MELVTAQISGLGNQLFQYAAGRYYSFRYGVTMRMVLHPAKRSFSYGNPRPFLLSHFNIKSAATEASDLERFLLSNRRSLKPFLQVIHSTLGIQIFREEIAQRQTFIEDIPLHKDTRTLYIVGYWQAHRFVDSIEDELRRELSFKEQATGKNLEVLGRIQESPCAVSLHVRRGDFTLAAEENKALPLNYYARAIDIIRKRIQNPIFIVFSDDIAFARANLPGSAQMIFVDHNNDYTSHEDLRLMSNCHHHIIANSSFSWWGAWLNPRPGKIVVAPKQWLLRKDTYFPQLMPPDWILLDVAAG